MNKTLKLSVSVIGIVAILSLGLWKWSSAQSFELAQTPTVLVQGDYNYYAAPVAPAPVEAPVIRETLGALPSGDYLPDRLCQSDDCTYSITGSYINASTTIVSVLNPFRAVTSSRSDVVVESVVSGVFGFTAPTTTVELVRLYTTNAGTSTASYSVACASAPNAYTTSTVSHRILESSTLVTSTYMIESGMYNKAEYNAYNNSIPSWYTNTSSTYDKILLTPANPYLICKVFGADTAGMTNPSNVFDGEYLVRLSRMRF